MFIRRNTGLFRETCTLQPNMEDTIEDFRKETMKALWQVFDTLDIDKKGLVHVSQLKVITSSIGMKMGMDKAEELIKHEEVKSEMDFQTYFNIVKTDLIDNMEGVERLHSGHKPIGERLNSVLKTCWTSCNFERNHKSKWLSFDHCLVLWRLFNFLSEVDDTEEPILPVKLHRDEATMLLKKFVDITGQTNKEVSINECIQGTSEDGLTFTEFINIFESECVTTLSKTDISHGLNYLQDTLLLNVLGKGMVWKRGFKVKNWKERWLVMTPKHIQYYVTSNMKVLKGTIEFDSECKVEVLPDRPSQKQNRFVIHTHKKPYEMSAPDMKTKNEWVSGIQLALDHVGTDTNLQREAARERRKARQEQQRLIKEEELRRKQEEEHLKQKQDELDEEKRRRLEDEELLRKRLEELEEERRKREMAEARFLEEKALKELEQQRLRELEEIKRELERLLEEERQAKKDEEIVRNLQARLLEEEFERREELELLKQQQDEMLRTERQQKAMLEEDKLEQDRILREAKERLTQLETEQAIAAQKMQAASDKLQKAEKDRRIMEEKVKLWKTPVGLARPIKPTPNPFVTHRGQGAFCDHDFTQNVRKGNSEYIEKLTMESKHKEIELHKSNVPIKDDTGTVIQTNQKFNKFCQSSTENESKKYEDCDEKPTTEHKDEDDDLKIQTEDGTDTSIPNDKECEISYQRSEENESTINEVHVETITTENKDEEVDLKILFKEDTETTSNNYQENDSSVQSSAETESKKYEDVEEKPTTEHKDEEDDINIQLNWTDTSIPNDKECDRIYLRSGENESTINEVHVEKITTENKDEEVDLKIRFKEDTETTSNNYQENDSSVQGSAENESKKYEDVEEKPTTEHKDEEDDINIQLNWTDTSIPNDKECDRIYLRSGENESTINEVHVEKITTENKDEEVDFKIQFKEDTETTSHNYQESDSSVQSSAENESKNNENNVKYLKTENKDEEVELSIQITGDGETNIHNNEECKGSVQDPKVTSLEHSAGHSCSLNDCGDTENTKVEVSDDIKCDSLRKLNLSKETDDASVVG